MKQAFDGGWRGQRQGSRFSDHAAPGRGAELVGDDSQLSLFPARRSIVPQEVLAAQAIKPSWCGKSK